MTGLQLEHWIIEGVIVLLGAWAVFKSLPREPDVDWAAYQQSLLATLLGDSVENSICDQPLRLLEWTDIHKGSDKVRSVFRRRLDGWIVVTNEDRAAERAEWKAWADLESVSLDWDRPAAWLSQLESVLTQSSQRFLFVASQADCQQLLKFLHQHPAVRDFTGAVVCINPVLNTEWLAMHFTHANMDVEANVSIPYFVCATQSNPLPIGEGDRKGNLGWKAIDVIECDAKVQEWSSMDEPQAVKRWVLYMATLLSKRKESV